MVGLKGPLGVFGGTFDPPHFGHLRLARAALRQLSLARVLWVPTADPPHKQDDVLTPVDLRLAMVAAAIKRHPAYVLSRIDVDRPGPHWAADTVRLLAEAWPGADLYYVMGGDSLRDLPTWGRPRDFLAACRLAVLRRPGDEVDLAALERTLPGITERVRFIDAPRTQVSATLIRERVAAGLSIAGCVPAAVARLIAEHGLYRESQAAR